MRTVSRRRSPRRFFLTVLFHLLRGNKMNRKPNAERFLGRVPGKASEFVHCLEIQENELVGIFERVSSIQQEKNKNLENQDWILTYKINFHKGIIASVKFQIEYSGKWGDGYAKIIREVGRKCRELGITKLIATSPDRFLRHPDYRSD